MSVAGANEFGRLERVLVKRAHAAFGSPLAIAAEWRTLGFTAPPDFERAGAESERFLELLAEAGAELLEAPRDETLSLDSIYVRDASVWTPRGLVLCRMGKPARAGEAAAQGDLLRAAGIPVLGAIEPPGHLEGGDVVWLDASTLLVGRGYRTDDEGIRQLADLLGPEVEVTAVPLVHWRGPGDVFHLMSILSPVASDLAVVYSPLLPVPLREALLARDMALVEVPDEEFDSMGANVLALAPRRVLALAGNPVTRARLERAGCEVLVYEGQEISRKGGGGPTCLTRPLARG